MQTIEHTHVVSHQTILACKMVKIINVAFYAGFLFYIFEMKLGQKIFSIEYDMFLRESWIDLETACWKFCFTRAWKRFPSSIYGVGLNYSTETLQSLCFDWPLRMSYHTHTHTHVIHWLRNHFWTTCTLYMILQQFLWHYYKIRLAAFQLLLYCMKWTIFEVFFDNESR